MLRRELVLADPLLSITEAAELLGVTQRTVRRLADEGDLSYIAIGRRRLFPMEALTEFIDSHTVRKSA